MFLQENAVNVCLSRGSETWSCNFEIIKIAICSSIARKYSCSQYCSHLFFFKRDGLALMSLHFGMCLSAVAGLNLLSQCGHWMYSGFSAGGGGSSLKPLAYRIAFMKFSCCALQSAFGWKKMWFSQTKNICTVRT